MPVLSKLQDARIRLQNTKLTKSGHNKFAGYQYFELGDFLPSINIIFADLKLCGVVRFTMSEASLTITDTEDNSEIVITSPSVEVQMKGCLPIQGLGAAQTYLRRYLWVNALEIVEHDALDATTGSEKKNHVHKPADNPAFKPDEEEKTFLLSVVDDIVSLKDDPEAASEKLYGQNLDNDQIVWIWNKLGPYPPLRTKIREIKRLKESKNEQI